MGIHRDIDEEKKAMNYGQISSQANNASYKDHVVVEGLSCSFSCFTQGDFQRICALLQ